MDFVNRPNSNMLLNGHHQWRHNMGSLAKKGACSEAQRARCHEVKTPLRFFLSQLSCSVVRSSLLELPALPGDSGGPSPVCARRNRSASSSAYDPPELLTLAIGVTTACGPPLGTRGGCRCLGGR